jgi:phosphatidate phosphatase APP1
MGFELIVVSDIDDTLFETSAARFRRFTAFWNTFFRYPKVVKDMPTLYNLIHLRFKPEFWYISASPYNLFPYCRSRISLDPYPTGHATLPTRAEAVRIYTTTSVFVYKTQCIEQLCEHLLSPSILLLGDSLMRDPEVYGEIYRRYLHWRVVILIRMIGDQRARRNSSTRFQKAFTEVPANNYHLFEKPAELNHFLHTLSDPLFTGERNRVL